MPDWESPKWRKEGRTGPGPIAPKYAKSKDRRAVRRGKDVGQWKGNSNPGGPGGSTRRIQTNKGGGGSKPPSKDCCPMVAAVRSVKQGKFRLARRYAAMSVRLMAAKVAA